MVSPDCCTEFGNGCFAWFFQKPIVAGQAVPAQFNVAELTPLMVMGTVETELVNVAEPVTVQLVVSGEVGHLADSVSVAVVALAVKEMVPGTVVVDPPQVSVKLESIVYRVPAVRSLAFTVRV